VKDTFEANKNKGPEWHKYNSSIRSTSVKAVSNLGPGTYDSSSNYVPLYKLKQSSGFASGTLRTSEIRKGAIANSALKNMKAKSQLTDKDNKMFDDGEEEEEYIEVTYYSKL
jgi:hypothetical protein